MEYYKKWGKKGTVSEKIWSPRADDNMQARLAYAEIKM